MTSLTLKDSLNRKALMSLLGSLLKKYRAENALLFGSYARDEADSESDIDVMVIGGEHFNPTDIFAIAEELHEKTGKSVDVYELREINEGSDLYHTIFNEGIYVI